MGIRISAAAAVSSVFGRVGAIIAAINDYAASMISAVAHGTTAATTVQGQLDELTDEKVDTTRTIDTTLPLTGGGDLSANRTLAVNDFGGDAGGGGTRGVVPAPSAGDAAANKYLHAGGGWSTVAGGMSAVNISAGTTNSNVSNFSFSNASGVSWGLNGSTITATVATNYQSQGAYLTTAALSNHSHGNPTLALTNLSGTTASASNGLTLSLSAGNYLTTAMASNRGSDFVQATAAFNGTNASGTIASNAISISVAAGAAGPVASFYMWPDEVQNSSAWQVSGSTSHVQPIYIPYDLSVSYIRIPVTMSCIGSQAATASAANQTRGMTMSSTINVQFFTQNTGASSRSLVQYASGQATWQQRATLQAGATGSHWSSGHTVSFPSEGGNTDFTSSAGATSASYTVNSTQLTNFTNLRYLDIPLATSFAQGAYWFMYGSSTSLSTSGNANMSTLRILASNIVATQVNQVFMLLGSASNSSIGFRQGLGSWTTNAMATTASVGFASISTSASHPIMPFQMIRQA